MEGQSARAWEGGAGGGVGAIQERNTGTAAPSAADHSCSLPHGNDTGVGPRSIVGAFERVLGSSVQNDAH